MREQSFNNYTIQYPNEITFAFNPQMIILKNNQSYIKKIGLIIEYYTNFGGGEIYEERQANKGNIRFDISRFLTLIQDFLVEKNGQKINTSANYDCTLDIHYDDNVNIDVFSFSGLAIFGAINIGDIFNPSRKITWFRQFPFNVSVYLQNGTHKQYRIDGGQTQSIGGTPSTNIHVLNPAELGADAQKSMQYIFGGVVNTFDFTFNYTFHQTSGTELFIDLDINDCIKGIYLRWLDKHGFYQYYLFEKATETLKNENNGDRIELDFTDGNEFYHGISTQNKNETKELKCATALADRNTREMLKTIFSSPIVEMYIGEVGENADDNSFVSVIVTAGSYAPNGQDLQDFEVVISLIQQTQGF